jgi:hypothetical protein
MPSTNPSDNVNGAGADIVIHVGQQLTVVKDAGWAGHTLSQPITDNPSVLRLTESLKGKAFAIYTAASPGFADIGGHSDACGAPASGCYFGDVQVLP